MKNTNLSSNSRPRPLGAAIIALTGFFTSPLHAQTIWDGGGSPDNSINNPTNWNNDIVNSFNESQTATFATAGTNATLNVNAQFKPSYSTATPDSSLMAPAR